VTAEDEARSGRQDSQLSTAYEQEYSRRDSFTKRLAALIGTLLDRASIDFALIESRTKTPTSLAEKIARKQGKYANPLRDIPDLSGIRIITYYLEDVERVGQLICNEFAIDQSESSHHSDETSADRFGYVSRHYVLKLGARRGELEEWNDYASFTAEVQVRTVLQHAWSSVSHKVAYKRESEVPIRLRRRLSRLSALFEIADEQFSQLRAETTSLEGEYAVKVSGGNLDLDLDGLSLDAYLSVPAVRERMDSVAKPAGWDLIAPDDSEVIHSQDSRDLFRIANSLGIASVYELHQVLSSPEWGSLLRELRLEHVRRDLSVRITMEDLIARALVVRLGFGDGAFEDVYSQRVSPAIMAARTWYEKSLDS